MSRTHEFSILKRNLKCGLHINPLPPIIKWWIKMPRAPNNSMRGTSWQDRRDRIKSDCSWTRMIDYNCISSARQWKQKILEQRRDLTRRMLQGYSHGFLVPLGWKGPQSGDYRRFFQLCNENRKERRIRKMLGSKSLWDVTGCGRRRKELSGVLYV